jgi:hypothetical protein
MKKMRSLAFILALLSLFITNVVAREYSPTTGRYIQFDPTGLDGGWNGFAYVSNDPLGSYDDNGLAQKKPTPSITPASPIVGGAMRGSQWRSLPPDLAPYTIPMAGGKGSAGAGRGTMGLPGCPPVLPDSALVCRGGLCTADRFAGGSGVKLDAAGKMSGASVNSAAEKTLKDLSATIPNPKLGVTTVGDVRGAGGDVVPNPTINNPYHCEMCRITPQQAEKLFTPVVPNPNR